MKQSLLFTLVVVMMLIFGAIMLAQIDRMEKRIKSEILAIVQESCSGTTAAKNAQ